MAVNGKTKGKKSEDYQKSDPDITILDILKSKIRLQLFFLLNVYGELSFTEISKYMGKSKPALHRHLQMMMEGGIIRVSREEKVRGSIMAKYYSIVENVIPYQDLDRKKMLTDPDVDKRQENLKNLLEFEQTKYFISKASLDLLKDYTEDMQEKILTEPVGLEKEYMDQLEDFYIRIYQFSEQNHKLFLEYSKELIQKINDNDKQHEKEHGKPPKMNHMYIATLIPLRKLMDHAAKKPTDRVKRVKKLF